MLGKIILPLIWISGMLWAMFLGTLAMIHYGPDPVKEFIKNIFRFMKIFK